MGNRKDTGRGQCLSATIQPRRWYAAALLCLCLAPGLAATAPSAELQILIDAEALGAPSLPAMDALLTGLPDDLAVTLTQVGATAADATAPALQRATATTAPTLTAALEALSVQWRKPSATPRLVIVVSGGCDASDCSPNSAAHAKIAAELLPRLQQSGAVIYTLAPPAAADHRLLQQLAIATGGWYQAATESVGVTYGIVRYLDSIARRDILPLQDGLMRIDESIDKVSVLLPRSDPNLPPRFTPPLKMGFSRFNAPENISWRQDADITAVTMTKPLRGTWQVEGATDPTARARPTGSMHLVVTPLPTNLLLPASQVVHIELQSGGKRITDRAVLDHVAVKVTQYKDGSEARLWFPLDDGRDGDDAAEDGVYTVALNDSLIAGQHELVVDVEGLGFQRQHRQVTVVSEQPAAAFWHPLAPGRFRIAVIPRAGMVNADSLSVHANLLGAGSAAEELLVPRFTTTEWRADITVPTTSERFMVELNVVGSTIDGKPLSIWLDPVELSAPEPASTTAQHDALDAAAAPSTSVEDNHAAPLSTAAVDAGAAGDQHRTDAPAAGGDAEAATPSILWSIVKLVLYNLPLLGLIAAATVLWRRSELRWRKTIEDALAHG